MDPTRKRFVNIAWLVIGSVALFAFGGMLMGFWKGGLAGYAAGAISVAVLLAIVAYLGSCICRVPNYEQHVVRVLGLNWMVWKPGYHWCLRGLMDVPEEGYRVDTRDVPIAIFANGVQVETQDHRRLLVKGTVTVRAVNAERVLFATTDGARSGFDIAKSAIQDEIDTAFSVWTRDQGIAFRGRDLGLLINTIPLQQTLSSLGLEFGTCVFSDIDDPQPVREIQDERTRLEQEFAALRAFAYQIAGLDPAIPVVQGTPEAERLLAAFQQAQQFMLQQKLLTSTQLHAISNIDILGFLGRGFGGGQGGNQGGGRGRRRN